MTPKLTVRTFSTDPYELDKVFYNNFYRLRGSKELRSTVVDIGAHCGYFTFTALAVGAKKVYAFEPYIENFRMLLENTAYNPIGLVVPHQVGVFPVAANLEFVHPKIQESHLDFSNIETKSNGDSPAYTAPCFPLDVILGDYVKEEVDILKINIGEGEFNILKESSLLESKVKNFCGQTVVDPDKINEFKTIFATKGFVNAQIVNVPEQDNKILFLFSKGELNEYFNI